MSMLTDIQQLMRGGEDEPPPAHTVPQSSPSHPDAAGNDDAFVSSCRHAHAALIDQIIAHIHAQRPEFFEYLVIDVLVAMGYGNRRRDLAAKLGRTGDGGIDGLIALDELALFQVYFQAKRLRPGTPVPIADVRDFAGSLEARHAAQGVFVTTTHFSPGAREFCSRIARRMVLIDGQWLAELMVRYNIGVKVKELVEIKQIDMSYFASNLRERAEEAPAPSWPRMPMTTP